MRKIRTDKSVNYVSIMDYTCCNPNCGYGFNVEGHHIYPLSRGGEDAYWNLISLCSKCHRGKGHHSTWDKSDVELFTYKCMKEIELFGYVLDERDPDFYEKFKKALLRRRKQDEKMCL